MMDSSKIACRLVSARADARSVDRDVVRDLKSSMVRMGLLNPITVRVKKVWTQSGWADGYELIAGRHRLQAAQELGWVEIDAVAVEMDDVAAELAMISENLHRSDLTALQRDVQVARWIELTDSNASQSATHKKRGQQPGGVNAASRELGIKRDAAHRAVKVAGLKPKAKEAAVVAGLDNNRTALLEAAAKETEDEQVEYLHARAAAVGVTDDKSRTDKQRDAFWKMWAKMDEGLRQEILAQLSRLAA